MTLLDVGLKIDGFRLEGVAVVVLKGELDTVAAPMLRAAFERVHPEEHVYVDCAGVEFVDSDGLAALCERAEWNMVLGGPLHVHASNALRRMVAIGGVGHLFVLD